ncbi:unnamed protein product [Calypogeia fissa]
MDSSERQLMSYYRSQQGFLRGLGDLAKIHPNNQDSVLQVSSVAISWLNGLSHVICASGINDSKKLSAVKREELYWKLTSTPGISFAVQVIDAGTIDEVNILQATMQAMVGCVEKLQNAAEGLSWPDYILVDGNRLPEGFSKEKARSVVKGDATCHVIAAASILAKVTRDRLMINYDKKWPLYGFKDHKGYGTAGHIAALLKHGPCDIHRRSFAPLKDRDIVSVRNVEILELRDEAGNSFTGWQNIASYTRNFYLSLFTSDSYPRELTIATVLDVITSPIPAHHRQKLEQVHTAGNLLRAASCMKKRKAPGPNGIPVEYYITFWPKVSRLIFDILNNMCGTGTLHPEIAIGMIALVPKKGNQLSLSNKRPITLLNTEYKICSTTMEESTSSMAQDYVSMEQSAFLPGRQIHHSILLTNELPHRAKLSGQDYIFLKLDVFKAFDRVEWDFLFAYLHKAGFGLRFINFIQAIYQNATSQVIINGKCS